MIYTRATHGFGFYWCAGIWMLLIPWVGTFSNHLQGYHLFLATDRWSFQFLKDHMEIRTPRRQWRWSWMDFIFGQPFDDVLNLGDPITLRNSDGEFVMQHQLVTTRRPRAWWVESTQREWKILKCPYELGHCDVFISEDPVQIMGNALNVSRIVAEMRAEMKEAQGDSESMG